jgi:HEAT repeat protein
VGNLTEVFLVAACAIGVTVLCLLAAITAWRLGRSLLESRRRRLAAPWRELLLEIAVADDEPTEELAALRRAGPASWAALQPQLRTVLGKIAGPSRDALVRLLVERGGARLARRRARSRLPHRRASGAHLLGLLGRPEDGPLLARLLADRDPRVRAVATRALGRSGWCGAARHLLAALEDPVRPLPPRPVAAALLNLGDAAVPALLAAVDDAGLRVATAVEVLGGLRVSAAVGPLLAALQTGVPEIRLRAARALGRIGASSAVGALRAVCGEQGNPPELRLVCAGALGAIGDPAATPELSLLLRNPEHRVRLGAADALVRLGPAGVGALRQAAAEGSSTAAGALAQGELRDRRRVAPAMALPNAAVS